MVCQHYLISTKSDKKHTLSKCECAFLIARVSCPVLKLNSLQQNDTQFMNYHLHVQLYTMSIYNACYIQHMFELKDTISTTSKTCYNICKTKQHAEKIKSASYNVFAMYLFNRLFQTYESTF